MNGSIYASSSPVFLRTARQAAIRSSEYSPDALVAVIFSHLSLEAFVNEVLYHVNSRDSTTLPEPLAKLQIRSAEILRQDLKGQRTSSLVTKMKVIGVC